MKIYSVVLIEERDGCSTICLKDFSYSKLKSFKKASEYGLEALVMEFEFSQSWNETQRKIELMENGFHE